jgi:DNA-binding LacI/PurR family transcriptional regulator
MHEERMAVSIKDIAKVANVSYSTVSRALADSPRVKPETREKIKCLAAEMKYSPSALARSLVTRRTRTIGLVATTMTDLFQAEVIDVIEETALDQGYSVILTHSGVESEREQEELQALRERRVDGVILISVRANADYAAILSGMGVPVVFINNDYAQSVRVDNLNGAVQAVRHLLDLGHRRIAYIAGPSQEWDNVERRSGYERALRERGLVPDPVLMAPGDSRPEGGTQAMRELLGLAAPPTAVFCYNDATALGAMRAIHAEGFRVPRDVSVVGFDDIDLAAHFNPPLTTFAQPKRDMGLMAVRLMMRMLAGERIDGDGVLPGSLIIRESTMPPRAGALPRPEGRES